MARASAAGMPRPRARAAYADAACAAALREASPDAAITVPSRPRVCTTPERLRFVADAM